MSTRQAAFGPQELSIDLSTEQDETCGPSQNALSSETNIASPKTWTPVPLEPALKVAKPTSSLTQSFSKSASKRQRGSGVTPAWHPPSSKFRGVTRHRRSGRWEANIWLGKGTNKQFYLGSYDKEEFAAEAYDVASLKAKGTAAATNFGKGRYMGLWEAIDSCTMDELITAVKRGSQGFARGCSSYRGVSRHFSGRYEARLGFAGNKHMYLGVYSEEMDAAKAYDESAVRLKGRHALTNFLVADYGRQVTEHELKQLEMKNPNVFHALCCHASTAHAWDQLHAPELPTLNPLFPSENPPQVSSTTFPCSDEMQEGICQSRLADAVAAAAKYTVASGVPGMHTQAAVPATVLPSLPTLEDIELPDSKTLPLLRGSLEGTMQEWLKSGYPDKEFNALARILCRVKAQNHQSGQKQANEAAKETETSSPAVAAASKNLVAADVCVPAGTLSFTGAQPAPPACAAVAIDARASAAIAAAGISGAPSSVAVTVPRASMGVSHVSNAFNLLPISQTPTETFQSAGAASSLMHTCAPCASTPPSNDPPWSTLSDSLDAIMQKPVAPKPPRAPSSSREVGHFCSAAVNPEPTMAMHAHTNLPQFRTPLPAPLPAPSTIAASSATASNMVSISSELAEIAAQLHGSLEEKVNAIATHAATEAIHQTDVFANALRTFMQQKQCSTSSQATPSHILTACDSPHRKCARREVPMSRSDIGTVSNPPSVPASLLIAQNGSGYVTSGAYARHNLAFQPVFNPVCTGVQLPMPLHAAAGFPCIGAHGARGGTSASVSTGVASGAAHACTQPLLYSRPLFPSQNAAGPVGHHASLSTGSHASAALNGSFSAASCMPPPQLPKAAVDLCSHSRQQHMVPQQHSHMPPISPVPPNAFVVPATSLMWQQPTSLMPVFYPAIQPAVHNSVHLWPQAPLPAASHA